MTQNDSDVNFGFTKVSTTAKRSLVDEVFANVASKYDIMNDFMSFGAHRLWKHKFCNMIPNLNSNIIDVASGTGDIAITLKKRGIARGLNTNITACDINPAMLKICWDRSIDNNLIKGFETVVADAQNLPFVDKSFDYYTIAFGIRNAVDISQVLREAYRVLKPTGKFLCLEFSKVQNSYFAKAYEAYSFNLIPKIGEMVTQNRAAYQYLVESIKLFPNQQDFKTMIYEAGFKKVEYQNMTGGVVAVHWGFKI